MSPYEIRIEIKIQEGEGSVDTNPVEQADGSFRLVISGETASSIDECEQALLRTNFAAVRQALSAHLSTLSKKKARACADQEGGVVQPHDTPYQVDGEVGRFTFTTHGVVQGSELRHRTSRWFFPALQAKEWYRTRGFKELALVHGVVDDSYRKTTDLINRLRHQSAEEGTPSRTLCDTAEGEGRQILAQMERQADRILQEHHFTQEGEPEEEVDWGKASTTLPPEEVDEALEACDVPDDWKAEMRNNPVSYEEPSSQVYPSMDGVGVKKQRAERRPDLPKRRRKHPKEYVYTTLAQVDHEEGSYVLVGSHTVGVLRLLLAFLLDNGLWKHGLTFLTDGQKTLQGAILRAFSWWGHVHLLLDWYHLDEKCKQSLSLAMKGRDLRNAALEKLRPLLWHGLTDRAIQFLQQLDPETIKQPEARDQLIASLQRNKPYIPCYAVRQKLGLRNSSNRGEKANDLVVSERQKHNGMSWSPDGSVALAAVTALVRNQGQDTWFKQKVVSMVFSKAA
jgi:hypothetical protein